MFRATIYGVALVCLACLLAFDSRLAAQEFVPESTQEDRRGLTDEVSSVRWGRFQLEGGYSFVYDSDGAVRGTQHYLPDLLLRCGLTERLELRFGWPGWQWSNVEGAGFDESSSETLDPNFGLMYDLWPQHGILPQTAVLAAVPVSFDGDPFAVDSWQPLTQLLYAWYVSERGAITGSTGFGLFDDRGDDYLQLQQSLGYDFAWTDRTSTFVEWETYIDHGSADDGAQHLLGGGFSYLLTERFDVGCRAGLGLNERAPDFLTGIRFTVRF